MEWEGHKNLLREFHEELLRRYGRQAQLDVWWPLTHSTEPPEWIRVVHAAVSLNSSRPLIVKGAESLAGRGLLQASAIVHISVEHLSSIIEGGLARSKAQRLRGKATFLEVWMLCIKVLQREF